MEPVALADRSSNEPTGPMVVGAGLPMLAGGVSVAGSAGTAFIIGLVFSFMVSSSASPSPPRCLTWKRDSRVQRRARWAVIGKMVALVLVVGFVSAITGAWWVGVAAAALGVRVCVGYARLARVGVPPPADVPAPQE